MELQNGYKVIYDVAAEGEHRFYASKTGFFKDADEIGSFPADGKTRKYKLVYEKDGRFFGSETGIPSETDDALVALDKVFVAAEEGEEDEVIEEVEEVVEEEDEEENTVEPTDTTPEVEE